MKIIIFDYETFKYDVLLGTKIIDKDKTYYYQTWDKDLIKKFYSEHSNDIWIGWNNQRYDNLIHQAVVRGQDPKKVNDKIIKFNDFIRFDLKLFNYDLYVNHEGKLKAIEAFVGKNISESEVDFELDRPLTEEEKRLTEKYNRDDLDQTFDNFNYLRDEFNLRLELIKEFNLSLNDLSITGTQVAEKVLGAQKIWGIEKKKIAPIIYDNLRLKNQELIQYYLDEKFRTKEKLIFSVCGVKHTIGSGGAHGAIKNVTEDWALYLDVSGYYNLVMLNFDLLPRTLSEEGKEKYRYAYHEQLKLKGVNDMKRGAYKTILLSVFGAMINANTGFSDPQKGLLVTITGQLFIIDLLEHLEGKVKLLQTNTDGIMVKPLPGYSEEEILAIVQDWMDRTGFVIKPKKIYNITQRDVNNYIYVDEKGKVHAKGEAVKHYGGIDNPFATDAFKSKEALIIHYAIVNYIVYGKSPEETVEEYKNDLRYFQYICKKNSYDYVQYEKLVDETTAKGKTVQKVIYTEKIQDINRAFASIDKVERGQIRKYRFDGSNEKISNLPDSVFIYNHDIRDKSTLELLKDKIDYEYYVIRSYEKIIEFLEGKKK